MRSRASSRAAWRLRATCFVEDLPPLMALASMQSQARQRVSGTLPDIYCGFEEKPWGTWVEFGGQRKARFRGGESFTVKVECEDGRVFAYLDKARSNGRYLDKSRNLEFLQLPVSGDLQRLALDVVNQVSAFMAAMKS